MVLTEAVVRQALEVTGRFEGPGAPFAHVAGDFDGMGLSLGVLQWNIGSGTLQPLVRAAGEAAVLAAMPDLGRDLWRASTVEIVKGLAIARRWQDGTRLRPGHAAELVRFAGSDAFVAEQVAAARKLARKAMIAATEWAEAWGRPEPLLHELLWFFDLLVQNGGLSGVTAGRVRDAVGHGGAAPTLAVTRWLAARTAADRGFADAHRNVALWSADVPAERVPLLVASHLRALRARSAFRADVLNRKGTIAVGRGWVHGRLFDLTPEGPSRAAA